MCMEDFDIGNTALGRKTGTPEHYDPSLLFRIPRSENRVRYGLSDSELPFVGVDTWNCYELSFLLDNGLPVSRMLKIIYSCKSSYLIESKSVKLYLNSFNMDSFGATIESACSRVLTLLKSDLEKILETEVTVAMFDCDSDEMIPFKDMRGKMLTEMIPQRVLLTAKFEHFNETPELLHGVETAFTHDYDFRCDVLRSNCRVTNQPDWGDLFVRISTKYELDLLSVVRYLVSFRKENHFHEEVVEMIYKRLWDKFQPSELMVAAMYTRRGGVDINPLRASHKHLIDRAFVSTTSRLEKTMRQ